MKFFDRVQSEDLPHESGIKTRDCVRSQRTHLSRKTCPTNRGLRLQHLTNSTCIFVSEDLPHESGIKTVSCAFILISFSGRKTCPTNRGLRQLIRLEETHQLSRKTCPTNRGLRLK